MYRIFIVIFLFLMLACGTQKKLQRSYVGKPITQFEQDFGKAVTVIERTEGEVYIFEQTEELSSTEISQAKLTLDPMVTPNVTKTERYYVTVKDGKIVKIEQENEYERQ